ncbi:MAG TPA: YciI family protein [Vicinamibacterales bacterium]|nr:YciI family protein [Vicinamibacterales bacterium]
MKFMVQMNVKKGPYQMEGWSQDEVKRMVAFMNELERDLKTAGQWVAAEGLVSPEEARLVTANHDGTHAVTDAPFAESKEFIAGFWIIDVKDATEAYKFAARVSSCPGPGGKPLNMPVEVRAVGGAPA